MNHIYLCGHTGSSNRGCDAIVRSTAGLIRSFSSAGLSLMTFAEDQDRQLKLDAVTELLPYPRKNLLQRAAGYTMRNVFHDGVYGQRYLYKGLMARVLPQDMLLAIGGDTYCYGSPYGNYALNEAAEVKGIPTVFWGCSVDERVLHDPQMRADINRYSHIIARETLSLETLHTCVDSKEKLRLACDPAFTLEEEVTSVPEGFIPGHTVGINISPLVLHNRKNANDILYQNVFCLIDYILKATDMGVCLIPHVFDLASGSQDLEVLRVIHSKYKDNRRVSLVEGNLNSAQLKYIIARCRFFVGARTHATIAAYSSMVPALALSYSVKSLGIARDIFGTYDSYALPWKQFTQPNQLRDAFIRTLQENEETILAHYRNIMPDYKQQIVTVSKELFTQNQEEAWVTEARASFCPI